MAKIKDDNAAVFARSEREGDRSLIIIIRITAGGIDKRLRIIQIDEP